MTAIAEVLAQAFAHHQAGRLAQAEPIYREILQADPRQVDALQLLGMLLDATGRSEQAIEYLRAALRSKPDFAEVHNNLGSILLRQGKREEACACFHEAVRLKPDFAEAHAKLGYVLSHLGKIHEAVACYREAIRRMPGVAAVHNNLGAVLKDLGQMEEAAACYREAIRLMPELAEAHYNLAIVLQALDQHEEAAESYRETIRLKPEHAEAHSNLGNALHLLGRSREAVPCLREAIRLKPDYVHAHVNLGAAMQAVGQYEEAAAACREAIRLKPDHAEAYTALGSALESLGRPAEMAGCLREAIRLKPDYVDAHFNLSLAYLKLGNYEEGWSEYEWRWRCSDYVMHALRTSKPVWDGTDLEKRTIFVYCEQALGDTLQFIRYASLLQARGGRVIFACQRPLLRLLQGCAGIDHLVVDHAEAPPYDVQVPLLSLPRILGTTLTTVPAAVPYLRADPALVEAWRRELSGSRSFKVGLTWKSAPNHPGHLIRSIPLRHFAALARVADVQFFSLQKHYGLEQLREVAGRLPVRDLSGKLDVAAGPFMDTAAVMGSLDLVITADTAVAHLAGGLGIPVWVGLPFASDWRWIVGRDDSPWYPTMRLFQQREPGNWDEVFERIAVELARKVRKIT